MRHMRFALATTAAALVFLSLQPTPAFANDCQIKPFDAYNTAVKRGWKFTCHPGTTIYPGAVVSTLFLPEPQGPLLCQWRTGPVPVPSPNNARMNFFQAGGNVDTLKNGWQIKSYEITGGQWMKVPLLDGHRLSAQMRLDRHNHTYNYRLTKLVLHKQNGECAKAIDQAF